jgi:protein ImuB
MRGNEDMTQMTSITQRRFLCLWLPRLATDRLATDRLQQGDAFLKEPVATVQTISNSAFLDTVNTTAQAAGLRPGMSLASARAICPTLTVVEAQPSLDRAFLERLALWCDRFTPLVALDGSDGLMLDISGCTHLFGETDHQGERAMMRLARDGLAAQGVTATAAIAATSGAATALARFGGKREIYIPIQESLRDALAPLPIAALGAVEGGLTGETLEGLTRVGLRRIGDLTGLARASLASRFGLALTRGLDKALGHDPRPIALKPIRPPYRVRLSFPDPIGMTDDITAALQRLLDRLCARLETEGRGCRRLDWTLQRADGSDQIISIGTARPARDPHQLATLFAENMGTIDPHDGIDSMLLSAPRVEGFQADQDPFALAQEAGSGTEKALSAVIDRLVNRLGSSQVFRLTPVDSHAPDRAQDHTHPLNHTSTLPGHSEKSLAWPTSPARPLKLLDSPYAIQPLTGADGLNAPTAFRLFGRRTPLRLIQGPERIAPEWWRSDPRWATGVRDYFDVEDETGRRYWIYRDHATGKRQDQRWYLQGLY